MGHPGARTWTAEDEETLREYVLSNRDRIGVFNAIREGAMLVGRSFFQAKNRWYSRLNPEVQAADVPEEQAVVITDELANEHVPEHQDTPTELADLPEEKIFYADDDRHDGASHSSTDEHVAPPLPSLGVDEYVIKVAPITKKQLDVMSTSELYDLLLNVVIKIQDSHNKALHDNAKLSKELHMVTAEKEEVRIGYVSLLNVINTARKMAVKEGLGDTEIEKPKFKMDTNGNLERIG